MMRCKKNHLYTVSHLYCVDTVCIHIFHVVNEKEVMQQQKLCKNKITRLYHEYNSYRAETE